MDREAAARAIDAFLRALGRDPSREPILAGTPERVAATYADDLLSGYDVDVKGLLDESVFVGTSNLVAVRNVPIATTCPHHLMPSIGTATIVFAPGERLIGVGTVVKVVNAFARRLAMQEQIGQDVVAALHGRLAPRWVACRIKLVHTCMTARGTRSSGAHVETLAFRGAVDEATLHAALGAET